MKDEWTPTDLVRARELRRRHRRSHPVLVEAFEARDRALHLAFGIADVDRLPTGSDRVLVTMMDECRALLRVESPFAGFLEAPPVVHGLYAAHATTIGGSIAKMQDGARAMIADIVYRAHGVDPSTTVTADALVAHGWDPRAEQPDPMDFM